MSEIAIQQQKDVSIWTDSDAKKEAQIATGIGDAAISLAKSAKDVGMLESAIVRQIGAQADFVEWWDKQEKDKGGGNVTGNRSVTGAKIEDYGLNKMLVSRWRKKYKTDGATDEAKVDAAINDLINRNLKVLMPDNVASENHRAIGTSENEWYTPPQFIELAREVLGVIDLDPATSELANSVVKAGEIFTKADNGLEKEWHGNVWMNPPYSQPHIADFCQKLSNEYVAGRVEQAIALTHNYTDTSWFHGLASVTSAICFTRGRIGFESPAGDKAAPTQGQAFFYLGKNIDVFVKAFASVGLIMVNANA